MSPPAAPILVVDGASLDDALAAGRQAWAEGTTLVVRRALEAARCEAIVRGVYSARGRWVADFDGEQFALGRAWYTHLEQGRTRDYFQGAQRSDEDVEAAAPGLQAWMRDVAARLAGEPVMARARWCGPGLQLFPAGQVVSRRGGCVHFDLEGLPPAMRDARVPARSLVLMLQPPMRGGALRLWDDRWRGPADDVRQDGVDAEAEAAPAVTRPPPAHELSYGAGDLFVFDSYQLHQIAPFEGERDRVTAAAHAARGPGGWELWF